MAQTVNPAVAGSVAATIQARCERAGYSSALCIETVSRGGLLLSGLGNLQNWFNIFDLFNFPTPLDLGEGGSFGGGGAWEEWSCTDFDYKLDANGDLLVPPYPLKPQTQAMTPTVANKWMRSAVLGGVRYGTESNDSVILWFLHQRNSAYSDKRDWYGVYGVSSGGAYSYMNQSYFNAAGTKISKTWNVYTPVQTGYSSATNPPGKACPSGGSGGDFHFYLSGNNLDQCTMYAPNRALSKSGYAYPDTVAISRASVEAYMQGLEDRGDTQYCNLSPEIIRRLADEIWKRAAAQAGYTGAPYTPVETQDVRIDADPPNVTDLKDPPTLPEPGPSPTPYPPSPTPTPSPTAGGDEVTRGDYDHVPEDAADPVAGEIDWWPELPTISFDFGSPQCPTYDLSIAEWGWNNMILDSHCTLLEGNRATISVIMVLIFTIIGIRVVLDA